MCSAGLGRDGEEAELGYGRCRSYRGHPRLRDLVSRVDGIKIRFVSVYHVVDGSLNTNLELQAWITESMSILACDLRCTHLARCSMHLVTL